MGVVELRLYMGPKQAQIPRGAIVKLVGKIGNKGVIEWEGKRHIVPMRILWRIKEEREGDD